MYNSDGDFLFPSLRMNGVQPLMPDRCSRRSFVLPWCEPGSRERRSDGIRSGTALQRTFGRSEWMSRSHKNCSGKQTRVPRWTSIRRRFPQTSGMRATGKLSCC